VPDKVLDRPLTVPPRPAGGRSREALVWGGGAWLILRVVTSLAAWASPRWLAQGPTVAVPGYTAPVLHGAARVLAGSWLRADALWYLRIATHGYAGTPGSFAFLPLFPLLVRAVMPLVGGRELYAGLIVANAACLLGFVALFKLVETLLDSGAARACVVGLAVFPTSFFLVAPYGEPLLLATGAGALLAAAKGRPGLAGLAGALAALSRPFGVLLTLPLAGFAFVHYRQDHGGSHQDPGGSQQEAGGSQREAGRRSNWWVAPLGPVAGLMAWLAWSAYELKSIFGPVRVQALWQRTMSLPWVTLAAGVRTWFDWRGSSIGPYELLDVGATAFGIALVVVAFFAGRRRGMKLPLVLSLAGYGLAVLILPLSSPFLPRPLMSMPRFVLALFPLFFAYAILPRWSRIPLAIVSAAGLAWATAAFVAARPIF
jgi:hypothetical protein